MKLSKEKCQFRQTEITYLGERLTQHGVKPDVDKIKAINEYAKPTNKQDVQRLLGMVNFVAKFGPQVSEVTAPLCELIQKNVPFHWLDIHDKAFSDLKNILTKSDTLKYYDVTKSVTLQVDASQHGLGAALIPREWARRVCFKGVKRNSASICPNRERAAGHSLRLQTLSSVCL